MRILILLSMALFPVSPLAIGQEQSAEINVEAVEDVDFDEITVMGARSLGSLRAKVVQAEDAVFDLYNVLNDDDAYDIICKKEAPIGSQLPRRVCRSRVYRDAAAEAAEEMQIDGVLMRPAVNEARHSQILREKMRTLANENPELMAALRERLALKKKFEAERAKKFD